MEAKLYASLYKFVWSLAHPRRKRVIFNDHIIVMVYLWSVLWDRPVSWACDKDNWFGTNDFELPSDSAMSNRLRNVKRAVVDRAVCCPPARSCLARPRCSSRWTPSRCMWGHIPRTATPGAAAWPRARWPADTACTR